MKKLILSVTIILAGIAAQAQTVGNLTNLPSAVLGGMTTNLRSRNIVIPFDPKVGITLIAWGADSNTLQQAGNATSFNLQASTDGGTTWTTTTPFSWSGIYTGAVAVGSYLVIPPNHTNAANFRLLRLDSIAVPTNGTFYPTNISYRSDTL